MTPSDRAIRPIFLRYHTFSLVKQYYHLHTHPAMIDHLITGKQFAYKKTLR